VDVTRLFWIALVVLSFSVGSQAATVCQTLRDAKHLDHVELEGPIEYNWYHGGLWLLDDQDCGLWGARNGEESSLLLTTNSFGQVHLTKVQEDASSQTVLHEVRPLAMKKTLSDYRWVIQGIVLRNPWWWAWRAFLNFPLTRDRCCDNQEIVLRSPVVLVVESIHLLR
jgi:hypothetical protein